MNTLTNPGDTMRCTVNGVTIQLQVTIDGGFTRFVMTGPTVVEALSAGYTDEHTARTQARHLAQALNAGRSIWDLAAEYVTAQTRVLATADQILDEAMQVACAAPVTDRADVEIAHLQGQKPADTSDVAERINADLNTRQAADRAAQEAFNAQVAEIMATSRGFRDDREAPRCPTHPAQPQMSCPECGDRRLNDTVPAPTGRKVRNTRTGVHRKDLNDLQSRLVADAHTGEIRVGNGVRATTLRAIHDKIGGRLNYKPGMGSRKVIASLTLRTENVAA